MIRSSNSFTAIGVSNFIGLCGSFDVSISGVWVGSVNLERSLDAGVTWGIVATYAANIESVASCASSARFRFNCTAYTSGAALCQIGAGAN